MRYRSFPKELVMIALFKGLGLLLQDNELYRSPFEKQVQHWKGLSEEQIRGEVALLAKAKGSSPPRPPEVNSSRPPSMPTTSSSPS